MSEKKITLRQLRELSKRSDARLDSLEARRPNLQQNDPEAPDYIYGRTHYSEYIPGPIVTEDMISAPLETAIIDEQASFVRVMEAVFYIPDLVGTTILFRNAAGEETARFFSDEADFVIDETLQIIRMGDQVLCVPYGGAELTTDSGNVYLAEGLWVYTGTAPTDTGETVVQISFPGYENIVPLDPKFLPESIARREEILSKINARTRFSVDIALSPDEWLQTSDESYPYVFNFYMAEVTEDSLAEVMLDRDSGLLAAEAGMSAICETAGGIVIFRSVSAPTGLLTGKIYITISTAADGS